MSKTPKPLSNPYLQGVLLGLLILGSYLILGAGLGASGGFARAAAEIEKCFLPEHTLKSAYFGAWGPDFLNYYLVFMVLGVFIGGGVSALACGRAKIRIERGLAYSRFKRLILALIGGVFSGYAARIAMGCTSGQALSGGALLLTGSLVFMAAVFAAGYIMAIFFRRQWND